MRWLLPALILLCSHAAAALATERWEAAISEDQVRNGPGPDGSTGSPGSGFADFDFDPTTSLLHYTISWQGLLGELIKLHVHGPAGPDDSNPNHLFEIFNTRQEVIDAGVGFRTGSVTRSIELDDTTTECKGLESGTKEVAASDTRPCLHAELVYVNVHTDEFPMGEIRGNLQLVPEPQRWLLQLCALLAVGRLRRRASSTTATTDATPSVVAEGSGSRTKR